MCMLTPPYGARGRLVSALLGFKDLLRMMSCGIVQRKLRLCTDDIVLRALAPCSFLFC